VGTKRRERRRLRSINKTLEAEVDDEEHDMNLLSQVSEVVRSYTASS